jgi:hypothetical protein
MHGFAVNSKPRAIENNIRLVRELKDKFSFVYAVHFSLLFIYIYSQVNARNVGMMATEASNSTQSSSNLSTTCGLKIRRTTV